MSTTTTTEKPEHRLTKKDFESDQDVRWCPGCGDYAILNQVQKLMPDLGVASGDVEVLRRVVSKTCDRARLFRHYFTARGRHSAT